ncbi:GGDEF domain-containing protein [Poseidonibacter ostreae]|uniref:diguanylate cyclase n=1 Tax=Poseidonibacter ostreae TaxID=2654171 RepID=A0A6L4WS93_9BACT|nr:GGDEF domain-containing protein [Poseidonibacter ostreae]KAB7887540.1 diguanylate cyclase [Poseidonibacter ostreae]KAB7888401.1 diguanylate cyclase [Poseidonibacter ostreae]KAB7888658.1 diguanylate cyclase [Poseidonibacter ostreae]
MITYNIDPYKTLKSIIQVTSSCLGEEYLKIICDELKVLFNANLVFITEAIDSNPTTKVKILYSTNSESPENFLLEDTPCKLIYDNKIIQITKSVNIDFPKAQDTTFESFYGIPINNKKNECIGHLAIFSEKIRKLPKEIEDIALIFSKRIELEYQRIILENENKKMIRKLLELSEIDPLTNLYNRRFFCEKCNQVFIQSKRNFNKASLIFLDLDDFKEINDKYGHAKGDYVLKEVGTILKQTCRKDVDFISRIGGEEFGIICLNSPIHSSLQLAKRIMANTNDFFKNEKYNVTYSIGIEEFDSSYDSWEDIYNLADKKMYKAKASGKNKIIY